MRAVYKIRLISLGSAGGGERGLLRVKTLASAPLADLHAAIVSALYQYGDPIAVAGHLVMIGYECLPVLGFHHETHYFTPEGRWRITVDREVNN